MDIPSQIIHDSVKQALLEDLGDAGDITSKSLFDSSVTAKANIICKTDSIVAGIPLAQEVFHQIGNVNFESLVTDGQSISAGTIMAKLSGEALSILSGERVALNFLSHLGGIASLTSRYVAAVSGTKAKVCCTRKTVPLLRYLQKYAVRCGGATNHRLNLSDAMLIKDNHIAVAGGVAEALSKARSSAGKEVSIEIEVDTLEQLSQVLQSDTPPNTIMLDNMSLTDMKKAVEMTDSKYPLEASGNVTLDTITAIAETGVDYISTSQITQSAPALDMGLDIEFD